MINIDNVNIPMRMGFICVLQMSCVHTDFEWHMCYPTIIFIDIDNLF